MWMSNYTSACHPCRVSKTCEFAIFPKWQFQELVGFLFSAGIIACMSSLCCVYSEHSNPYGRLHVRWNGVCSTPGGIFFARTEKNRGASYPKASEFGDIGGSMRATMYCAGSQRWDCCSNHVASINMRTAEMCASFEFLVAHFSMSNLLPFILSYSRTNPVVFIRRWGMANGLVR